MEVENNDLTVFKPHVDEEELEGEREQPPSYNSKSTPQPPYTTAPSGLHTPE